jgi:hypothetical protein
MRVELYWNLNRRTYSVRDLRGESRGLVTSHPEDVCIRDVTFAVQPAGRAKVLRDKVKNVHAFVRGVLHDRTDDEINERMDAQAEGRGEWTSITYNPYMNDSFIDSEGDPISEAELIICHVSDDRKPKMFAWRNITHRSENLCESWEV